MFKIHTKDGKTEVFEIRDEKQAIDFIKKVSSDKFQENITAITILKKCGCKVKCPVCNSSSLVCNTCGLELKNTYCEGGIQHTISKSKSLNGIFLEPRFVPEDLKKRIKGGEKLILTIDKLEFILMVHKNQSGSRIVVKNATK